MKRMIKFVEERNPLHEEIQGYGFCCSLEREKAFEAAELRKFAADLMVSVSAACFSYGAKDVGHIKAFIEHDDGFLRASTLGDPADVTVEGRDGGPAPKFTVVLNAVIYGLSKMKVRSAAVEAFESLVSAYGLVSECEGDGEGHPPRSEQGRNEHD